MSSVDESKERSQSRRRKHKRRDYSVRDEDASTSAESSTRRRRRKDRRRQRHRSARSEQGERVVEHKRKHRECCSSSDDDEKARKKCKKRSKSKKRKHKTRGVEGPTDGNGECNKATLSTVPAIQPTSKEETTHPPPPPDNKVVSERARRMVPMSREQYETQRNIIREVYDDESGRYRLVRGTGEILERIVSKHDHERINNQATHGDGSSYSRHIFNAAQKR